MRHTGIDIECNGFWVGKYANQQRHVKVYNGQTWNNGRITSVWMKGGFVGFRILMKGRARCCGKLTP